MPTTDEILAEYYSDPRSRLKAPELPNDPYWVPPSEPQYKGEIKNLPARPAEQLSPTMGAYDIGQLLSALTVKSSDTLRLKTSVMLVKPCETTAYYLGRFANSRQNSGGSALCAHICSGVVLS